MYFSPWRYYGTCRKNISQMAGKTAPVALHIFSISCDKSKKTINTVPNDSTKIYCMPSWVKKTMTIQGGDPQLQTGRKTIAAWWFLATPS